MASPLSDLDELILKCRDQKAQSYIREAVTCYKAGAFRSAIVSTWIAVSFDIIEKLKELSLAGDKEAEKNLEQFERARINGDITNSLKFERDILSICKDKLELISPIEFIDLSRLQEDRNRCAHPSMTVDGEIFNPSAEMARMHIRSAVDYLLQYPPAQGKYALEYLISEVESEYFPTDIKKAAIAFEKSPLNKARDSLVRNFVVILLKKLINDAKDYREIYRISAALNAINTIHGERYKITLTEKLSSILRSLEAEKLDRTIPLLRHVEDSWHHLEQDVKQKLQAYVEKLPKDQLENIDVFLSIKELEKSAEKRINIANRAELDESLFFGIPPQVCERIIQLYFESRSFEQANSFAPVVIRYAVDYTREQAKKLVLACGKNDQIRHSYEVSSVINAIRKNEHVTDEELDDWLLEAGLHEFIKHQQ